MEARLRKESGVQEGQKRETSISYAARSLHLIHAQKAKARRWLGPRTTTTARHEGEEKKPLPIIDLVFLTAQIRTFIHDIGRQAMVLPSMETASRALVHKIAVAFNLKSKSSEKGDDRHITPIRTSKTGIGI
jgi:hypothetical protein